MSFGTTSFGATLFGGGGTDFSVTNQSPTPNLTTVSRKPTISFNIYSSATNIDTNSINVIVSGIAFITNGIFTSNATGVINTTSLTNIIITMTSADTFLPATEITVDVEAKTVANDILEINNVWHYVTTPSINIENTHISRSFNKISTTNAIFDSITQPQLSITAGVQTNYIYWTDITGSSAYNLYCSASSPVTLIPANLIAANISEIQYTHYNLTTGITYYYKIIAIGFNGSLGAVSAEVSATAL